MAEEGIRQAFAVQAEACEALGSPFTASLCRRLGSNLSHDTAVGSLCLNWPGDDPGPSGDSVPLRLCGGLHALVLTGLDSALAEGYPPHSKIAPAWDVIEAALVEHEAFLLDWMTSPPQTNEVGRAAVVWPAMLLVSSETDLPLRVLEVGASAGLNLQMDRFHYQYGTTALGNKNTDVRLAPQMRGKDVCVYRTKIEHRAACDINPLDPENDRDALRLRAYVWPDQADRIKRLNGALELAKANPVRVEKIDAIDWLRRELAGHEPGACSVIYSTIAWQYLPSDARAKGEQIITGAGARATADAPLAWLRFEADGNTPGAAISLVLWPGGKTRQLGRADFHGRWLDWHPHNI